MKAAEINEFGEHFRKLFWLKLKMIVQSARWESDRRNRRAETESEREGERVSE